jgi:Protein of unknown function (DUF2975)
MRLVGKRSAASGLRWFLGAANVFVTIGLVVVALTALASLVTPDIWGGFRDGFNAGSDRIDVDIGGRWDTYLALPTLGFVWLIINRLRAILASVNAGDAFEYPNVQRLRMVGWGLIGLQITSYVETIGRPFFEGGTRAALNLDGDMWIAILVVFILAEVFRQGAQMRDDAQMTV